MLSSIHPLGERTRHNPWLVTVGAFAIGSIGAGALVGAALGWLGRLALPDSSTNATLVVIGAIALTAGLFDVVNVPVPGPRRQVNEHWIGAYRGWVYGGAFGVQLGAGLMTFVVTWGVYATLLIELVSASPLVGGVIGAVFGAGRSVALFLAGRVDRASRLSSFHSRMAALGPPVRLVAGYGAVIVGLLSVAGVMLWPV
jgi:hypothetical protein